MLMRDYQAVPTGARLLQQKAPTGLLQEQTSRRLPPALQAQQECGSDQWSLLIRRFSKPVEWGQEPPRCPHPLRTQSFCPNIGRACPLAFCSCPAVCAISDFETECLTSPGQDQDTPLSWACRPLRWTRRPQLSRRGRSLRSRCNRGFYDVSAASVLFSSDQWRCREFELGRGSNRFLGSLWSAQLPRSGLRDMQRCKLTVGTSLQWRRSLSQQQQHSCMLQPDWEGPRRTVHSSQTWVSTLAPLVDIHRGAGCIRQQHTASRWQ